MLVVVIVFALLVVIDTTRPTKTMAIGSTASLVIATTITVATAITETHAVTIPIRITINNTVAQSISVGLTASIKNMTAVINPPRPMHQPMTQCEGEAQV